MSDVLGFFAAIGVDLPDRADNVAVRCFVPDHDDSNASASVHTGTGLWICHGCGATGNPYKAAVAVGRSAREAMELLERHGLVDPDRPRRGGGATPPPTGVHKCIPPRQPGCRLADYAEAKRLPIDFLRSLGVSEITYFEQPALRILYFSPAGEEAAVRLRINLDKDADGDNRFRWRKGSKVQLYGLDRLEQAREKGHVVLCEGESDAQTLWLHGFPAISIPGAGNWRDERDAEHLDGIDQLFVVIEPDLGGEVVSGWLAQSRIRERAWLVELGEHEDPSGLHLDDPDRFPERFQAALDASEPWRARAAMIEDADRRVAWDRCRELAEHPAILDLLVAAVRRFGLIGEERVVKLVYLATISRLFERPISVAVKGPSSGGKSFAVQQTLRFFPNSAYYALSAMSDRALAYSNEPVRHRMLVIYEAGGFSSDIASYLMRTLLSEGRIRYETVNSDGEGVVIEREGPTGLITTTTAVSLHPENETRLFSTVVTDTPAQTRRVMAMLAEQDDEEAPGATDDLEPWHALQTVLETGERRVTVPYAQLLAELVPPAAVRLRRDFKAVLGLIRAHALLHSASRRRDDRGRIVACHEDYEAVREIVADLVAEGIKATVKPVVRETVTAVAELDKPSQSQVARYLGIDQSAASRRCREALDNGYLGNLEEKRGRPAQLVVGDPLPDDVEVLPAAERLTDLCTYARQSEGGHPPPTWREATLEEEDDLARLRAKHGGES